MSIFKRKILPFLLIFLMIIHPYIKTSAADLKDFSIYFDKRIESFSSSDVTRTAASYMYSGVTSDYAEKIYNVLLSFPENLDSYYGFLFYGIQATSYNLSLRLVCFKSNPDSVFFTSPFPLNSPDFTSMFANGYSQIYVISSSEVVADVYYCTLTLPSFQLSGGWSKSRSDQSFPVDDGHVFSYLGGTGSSNGCKLLYSSFPVYSGYEVANKLSLNLSSEITYMQFEHALELGLTDFNSGVFYGANGVVDSSVPVSESKSDHLYFYDMNIGFYGDQRNYSSYMDSYNNPYFYCSYNLDSYQIQHMGDYKLNFELEFRSQGDTIGETFSYVQEYSSNLSLDKILVVPYADFKNLSYINRGFKGLLFRASGKVFNSYPEVFPVSFHKQDTDCTLKSMFLKITVWLSLSDGSADSKKYIKTYDCLNGTYSLDDSSIFDIPSGSGSDVGNLPSYQPTGSGTVGVSGLSGSGITNNPTFNNNNNVTVTVEGDSINNQVDNIVGDSTSKEDNDSLVDKFLGFFDLLKNNKFLSIFSDLFSFIPGEVQTVITSAIAIGLVMLVWKAFRR